MNANLSCASTTAKDIRYKRNDQKIRAVLQTALLDRNISLKPKDICKHAVITRPTFYAHCSDASDALRQYESEIVTGFHKRLTVEGCRGVVFTILLRFINEKRDYFEATIPNADYHLLSDIFSNLKSRLADSDTADKIYEIYSQRQIALICCWAKHDDFAKNKISFYAKKMAETRLVDLGL